MNRLTVSPESLNDPQVHSDFHKLVDARRKLANEEAEFRKQEMAFILKMEGLKQ